MRDPSQAMTFVMVTIMAQRNNRVRKNMNVNVVEMKCERTEPGDDFVMVAIVAQVKKSRGK